MGDLHEKLQKRNVSILLYAIYILDGRYSNIIRSVQGRFPMNNMFADDVSKVYAWFEIINELDY
jgi:hypothetical protein